MRTTLSIPDELYHQISVSHKRLGFNTINDFVLDCIRDRISNIPISGKKIETLINEIAGNEENVSLGLLPETEIVETKNIRFVRSEIKKVQEEKGIGICKHGAMKGVCKYGCK